MKEAMTKVIDTLTQEDFHGAFQKLLERYNKCIAAGGDYIDGDLSFMCVLSIKVPIRKKSGNLSYAPRIYLSIYLSCITPYFFFDSDFREIPGNKMELIRFENNESEKDFFLFICSTGLFKKGNRRR